MESIRVLIVDDEVELVHALIERLSFRGIDATGVNSGEEAIERIRTETYDVLLLDVKMPGMSGLEVIRKVRAIVPGLKVVLLSGHSALESAVEGINLGAVDYLIKPVRIEDLVKVLRVAAGQDTETHD